MSSTQTDSQIATAATAPPMTQAGAQATLRAAAFGEMVSVMLQSRRHAKVTMETVARQLLPAFLAGQYILARAQTNATDTPPAPVGFAFWASVSDAVDARLTGDPDKPITLLPEEWQSGDIVWLIDVVAAPRVSVALLKSVREKVGMERTVRIRAQDDQGKPYVKTLS